MFCGYTPSARLAGSLAGDERCVTVHITPGSGFWLSMPDLARHRGSWDWGQLRPEGLPSEGLTACEPAEADLSWTHECGI
jgi:hypothetical protein